MNANELRAAWAADRPMFERLGVILMEGNAYMPEEARYDFNLAMDAQVLPSTVPNSGVPAYLTTLIDSEIYQTLFSPNQAAEIFSEVKKGSWTDDTAIFPVVEHDGEVSSYGDFSEEGHSGANTNWPQRQSYLYQTTVSYGERELERAGLARLNWVSELDGAAGQVLDKFQNFTYFFGVQGLQNFGALNDSNLSAALTPSTKAAGGAKWITNGVVTATANEVYADIQSLFSQIVTQTAGLVDQKAKMTLAMSPGSEVALTATNSFNVNVSDLLKKNFPNITVKTAVQYGQTSAANPQGITAGNLTQLIADSVEGQQTGYCAFSEKMRSHPIVRQLSSFQQKVTAGTWGAIVRQAFGIAQMVGI